MSSKEELGAVTSRSGILVVIDTGYLRIWSHDQTPKLPNGVLSSEELTKKANVSVDLLIVGNDARRAGQMLAMSCHPLYVFDQPPNSEDLRTRLSTLTQSGNLDASFRVISPRISHRKRVDLALEESGAGEIQFHGVPAVVCAGVPVAQPMRILGERMPPPEHDRWRRVSIECRPTISADRSEKVGHVGVDYARLLIADVDALGMWEHERPLDGLSDFVFWGIDAGQVARKFEAPSLKDEGFGWTDISEEVALERGAAIENYRERKGLKFATDYRPHSHHWQVMKETRSSSTESGMTEIEGMTVCNFMTTWGDGIFEVYRDLGAKDELVSIRIEFVQNGD
jgi:hypothetical protein